MTHPLSNYPDELYNYEVKVDPTTESYPLIQQYQQLYSSGQIDEANQLMQDNKNLQQMVISAIDINKLGDAVLSIQEYYLSDVRSSLQTLIDYKGEWDAETQYKQFDMVIYQPTIDTTYAYICSERDTPIGTNPETKEYWSKVTIKGESGTGMTMRYDYLELDQYNINDCVFYKNKLWCCVQDCSNIAPDSIENSENQYWKLIFGLTAEDIVMSDEDDTSIKDYFVEFEKQILLKAHPVGSYYWSDVDTDPSILFGGVWKQITDRFVYASSGQSSKLGGSATVTLTSNQIPAHKHNTKVSKTTNLKGYISHICAQNEDLTNQQKSISKSGDIFTLWRNGVIYYGYRGRYNKGYDSFSLDVNHTHSVTESSIGGGQAHDNMPPYITAYCWIRMS